MRIIHQLRCFHILWWNLLYDCNRDKTLFGTYLVMSLSNASLWIPLRNSKLFVLQIFPTEELVLIERFKFSWANSLKFCCETFFIEAFFTLKSFFLLLLHRYFVASNCRPFSYWQLSKVHPFPGDKTFSDKKSHSLFWLRTQ